MNGSQIIFHCGQEPGQPEDAEGLPKSLYRGGSWGHNHHLCPIWPFRVSDFDRGREPQIQPGLRARHVRAGDMLGVSDSSGEKDLTSAELGDKWGRQGTPVSRNSSGKAVATRGLAVHLGSSSGWSTGCWGEGGRQSV